MMGEPCPSFWKNSFMGKVDGLKTKDTFKQIKLKHVNVNLIVQIVLYLDSWFYHLFKEQVEPGTI